MKTVEINNLVFRLKGISPETLEKVLPEVWPQLENKLLQNRNFFLQLKKTSYLSVSTLDAGKVKIGNKAPNVPLSSQIASQIYHSLNSAFASQSSLKSEKGTR